jgi:hypothetical protein
MPTTRHAAATPLRGHLIQALLLLPALVAALWVGWLVQQRLTWLQSGLHLQGRVVELSRSTQAGATASGRSAVRLEVVVDVPDPRREDRLQRLDVLAPLLYAVLEPGDAVTVLHDPLTLPAQRPFVLAHPLQLWQAPAFGLLAVAVLWAFPYTGLLRRHPQPDARRRAGRRRKLVLLMAALLPVVAGQALAWRDGRARAADLAMEAAWPAWPELDAAAPQPWWWARLPWHGLDPVRSEGSAAYAWLEQGAGWPRTLGQSERRFKWTRARMLALRDQPAEMAGLLSNGHDPNFIPLYRFYLQHYMEAEWRDTGCSRCNDSSLVTQMAGDLMWMLIQDGRAAEAGTWAPVIIARKLPGADARARLSLLTAYRGLLEAESGAEAARIQLQPLVEDAMTAAREEGTDWALARWQDFWRSHVPRVPETPPAASAGSS